MQGPPVPWYLRTDQEFELWRTIHAMDPVRDSGDLRLAMAQLSRLSLGFYGHTFGVIRDEDAAVQRFNRWNPCQNKLMEAFASQFYAPPVRPGAPMGQPVRLAVHKPRQVGSSSWFELLDDWVIEMHAHRRGMLLSHDTEITKRLFEILRRFHWSLPDWIRPTAQNTSRTELVLNRPDGSGLDSSIFVDTAGQSLETASKVGRGDTLQLAHLSELDYYRYPEETLDSLLQGIPNIAGTFVVAETTPNGQGGFWDTFWHDTLEGRTGFLGVYLCWLDVPYRARADGSWERKYSMDLPCDPETYRKGITDEEFGLIHDHGVNLNQIEFRRWMIQNKLGGKKEKFRQEYPITAEDGFIGSGQSVFTMAGLDRLRRTSSLVKPAAVGKMKETEVEIYVRRDKGGPLRIYKYPKPDLEYVLGYDPSAGYENGDFCGMSVLCRETLEFVAHYYAKEDIPTTAPQAHLLSQWYSDAIIVPDATALGMAGIWAFKKLGARLYVRRDVDRRTGGGIKDRWGYHLTPQTRPILIADLRDAIDGEDVLIYDKTLAWEADRFHVIDGKEQHAKNSKDDLLLSAALALRGHKEHGMQPKRQADLALKAMQRGLTARLERQVLQFDGRWDDSEYTGDVG